MSVTEICHIWEFKDCTNDNRPNAPVIFLFLEIAQYFLFAYKFLASEICPKLMQIKQSQNKVN